MKRTVAFDGSSDNLPVKIVAWLLENDYFPADSRGRALTIVRQEDSLGILWAPPPIIRPFVLLWSSPEREALPVLIAQLSFADAKDSDTKEWSMCIFGQAYLDLGRKLAEKLAKKFEVDIRLTSHQCREPEKHRWRILLNKFVQGSKLKLTKSI